VLCTSAGLVLGLLSNSRRIPTLVADGSLDEVLTLPVAPLPHLLVRRLDTVNLGDVAFGLVLFAVAAHPTPQRTLVYLAGTLASAVRDAIWRVDKEQPIGAVRTMDEQLSNSLTRRRFSVTLLTAFGVVAASLAAIGLYGVLAFVVAQRRREIGLRMALGAQTGNVVAGVLRAALRLSGIGVALGVVGAFAVTRFLGSFLFGVSPMDPTTLGGVALVLVAVTIVASWLPALRAARVDPMAALRSD